MEVREAILDKEKEQVRSFLNRFGLSMADDLTKTFYLIDDEHIIGTISCSNYIIKCLAVDESYQSENIASKLCNVILDCFNEQNIYQYQVYTKPVYEKVFASFGFTTLVKTQKVVMMEGGASNIYQELQKIKRNLELTFGEIDEATDIVGIVVNANPMTEGHSYLIEQASLKHKMVVVFVLEEDKSEFTYQERFAMVYLGTRRLKNVAVVPSTKYVISSLTFPTYFLKNKEEIDEEYAKVDALIFKNYLMKYLYLKKRYVGSESGARMHHYNETLKQILNDDLIIVDRLKQDGITVSASMVRNLIKNNQLEEALKYIPRENQMLFLGIVRSRPWN